MRKNVEQYVNPENLVSGYEKYQFMDLSVSNNVDSATLDTYLKGKGVLDGHGSEFKKAADDNNVSEVYLVIHSCLETGNGSSELATVLNITAQRCITCSVSVRWTNHRLTPVRNMRISKAGRV